MNAAATRGYYSLVQFCPDASRAEAVNLGVVLFCPELTFLDAILTRGNARASKLVGREKLDRTALQGAKRALERRLQIDRAAFQTLEDFQKFVATRGNALQLTAPRPVKVFRPQTELNELFQSLVGGTPRRNSEARTMFPKLDSAFRQLADEKLAELHVPITVPVLGKLRHVPYAYQNGVWNLIEPKRFSGSVQTAVNLASRMAIEGDLLRRHGI